MSDDQLFPVPGDWAARAHADQTTYQQMYRASVEDPEGFWAEQGKRIDWIKPYTEIRDVSYDAADLHIRWYYDGTLNASVNCIDRHL
ncbi:MAG TPA: acetyl-coenzyme A synthetase, partial [Alphaproteobacteria bacterium]|nr:acetyl-coenzyme A synthetase [Alphaproteobacteria bacterium]